MPIVRAPGRRAVVLGALLVSAVSVLAAPMARAACCYFAAKDKDINQPGQKAFITWTPSEKIESFTVQPKFEGNAVDFGMVIPTPGKPRLDEAPRDLFKDLAIYTILMPLPQAIWPSLDPMPVMAPGSAGGGAVTLGAVPQDTRKHSVKVLESGVVGSLDYKIIVAEQANDLFSWLKDNSYSYGGDEGTLDFYVKKKWFFTVMKIDPKQMKNAADGSYLGEVTPTRFTFETDKCIYPLKITQISVKTTTDALFYVQSPEQMDLEGDLSWMPSYRVMYLNYCLGCGATPEDQKELQARNEWLNAKRAKDPGFETCKLEWARKLGDDELAVLEDPVKAYAQTGKSALVGGGRYVELEAFLKDVWADWAKEHASPSKDQVEDAKARLKQLETQYPAARGRIVETEKAVSFYGSRYLFYPNREAPEEDVKGLARLKGHLQKGKWVTKFRKTIRKTDMSDDLVLVPVEKGKEQEYVRIMPTSPP